MVHIQHSVKIYWLSDTQSRVLQADWSILENNEKATLNINDLPAVTPHHHNKKHDLIMLLCRYLLRQVFHPDQIKTIVNRSRILQFYTNGRNPSLTQLYMKLKLFQLRGLWILLKHCKIPRNLTIFPIMCSHRHWRANPRVSKNSINRDCVGPIVFIYQCTFHAILPFNYHKLLDSCILGRFR